MDNKVFSIEELRCLKATVNYCIATRDLWDNEYVIENAPCNLTEADFPTLDLLRLKLESL